MSDPPEDDFVPSDAFMDRQADMQFQTAEPDASTSPEALDVLRRKGVEAYEQYVAQQGISTSGRESPVASSRPSAGDFTPDWGDWDEAKHPRDPDGKFGHGGGGASRLSLADWSVDEVDKIAGIPRGYARDDRLTAIQAEQGFDGLPATVSTEKFDALPADHQRVYRGINGSGDKARGWAEDIRSGDFYPGVGVYGSGMYTTTDQGEAGGYALGYDDGDKGVVVRMALRPDARVITHAELREQANGDDRLRNDEQADAAFGNHGRYAAALGYDAISVSAEGTGVGSGYYVVLNRRALIVEEAS